MLLIVFDPGRAFVPSRSQRTRTRKLFQLFINCCGYFSVLLVHEVHVDSSSRPLSSTKHRICILTRKRIALKRGHPYSLSLCLSSVITFFFHFSSRCFDTSSSVHPCMHDLTGKGSSAFWERKRAESSVRNKSNP